MDIIESALLYAVESYFISKKDAKLKVAHLTEHQTLNTIRCFSLFHLQGIPSGLRPEMELFNLPLKDIILKPLMCPRDSA